MGQQLIIRGVPDSIFRDSWWLENDPQRPAGGRGNRAQQGDRRTTARLVGLILLTAVSDWLFYVHEIGVSLVVIAVAVFVVSVRDIRPVKSLVGPAAVLVVSVLPVIEYTQFLSIIFMFLGLAAAVVWGRRPDSHPVTAWLLMLRGMPVQWVRTLILPFSSLFSGRIISRDGGVWRIFLRNWGLPFGGGLIFASLLIDANPILNEYFQQDWELSGAINRILFWLGIAVLIWPFLDVKTKERQTKTLNWRALTFGANPHSVFRSLWIFNALIAVQTVMDISILVGGASLPEGMTLAEYAHRGAYPLILTALLAGGFAVVAEPFLSEHRSLKPLMLLWLAQNVALCVSALLRLDLYIENYGLTYMRVYALIWMVLVATGLALTAWQIQRELGVRWLFKRVAMLGGGVLYLCCFVNFAHIITAHNIMQGKINDHEIYTAPESACGALTDAGIGDSSCAPTITNWRDWGFREWRVREYVATQLGQSKNGTHFNR